ncbi:MAG: helix-turn-helix domain-containing protein [Prevotellaceae bacterium]|jgi:AraC-like DNA-binding protein|nr:helix-turn-helix domain-containing protein [Prevotellaceae bacterium]
MKKAFSLIVFLLSFAATAQESDSFNVKQYSWSMNSLYYPYSDGCDSVFAAVHNEMRYYNSDSLFYKMATQGRTLEVEDLLHHFYYQILEDYATSEKIDHEYKKMRKAAETYNSDILENEADYMEIYFKHADSDSLWNVKDAQMNELMRKAAKNKDYASECRLMFELFNAYMRHRQYDKAFKYAAMLLGKMKNMTDSDYFKRRETYFHIGNAYRLFRDYPRAIECFRVAMQDGERLFFDRSGLRAKEQMANYYASVNQLDSADYYYRALYNSPEQVRFRPHYDFVAILGLAGSATMRGEYERALTLLQKFHHPISKDGYAKNMATSAYLRGICYLETNRVDSAKPMIDSTKIMLMELKANNQMYPRTMKEIDFIMKDWYDLMSRYCKVTGNHELEYAYRDSVYIIEKEQREETNTLIILRAEQELFETQNQLAVEHIRVKNYILIAISIAFILIFCVFSIFILFYRKMRNAYRQLYAKNVEWANTHNGIMDEQAADTRQSRLETEIMNKIYKLFENENTYTDINLSLRTLAERLNIVHRNYLSEAINTVCKCNFNTFINDYRIKFAIKVLNNPDYDKYSLEQVAEISGFSNRQSFYTSFKNKTGLTPAAFRKNRQAENID